MKTYEYVGEVMPDGHLSIPQTLRDQLPIDTRVRVVLLLDEEDAEWDRFAVSQFLDGYSEKDALYDSL